MADPAAQPVKLEPADSSISIKNETISPDLKRGLVDNTSFQESSHWLGRRAHI